MTEKICYNCFREKTQDGTCLVCGYNPEQDRDKYPLALPQGTVLNGQYILGRVLGQGGFGITYVAQDWKTKKRVAVKEYLLDTMATRIEGHAVSAYSGQREESFRYGMECFLSEAKTLAEFIGNENIVRIHSYFEENGTAYFVMEYVDGKSFQTYIRDAGGKIDWQDAERILFPVMDALGAVHAKGIIHRDVTPDNIFITEDGTVKLLDFGAARYSLGDRSRSLDVVLKHGYAPKEQYTRRGRQGAYTDVYSVAACFYFAVTGHKPPDSIERMDEDDLIPPSSLGVKVSETQEDALLKGLSVQAVDRYQNMADFKAAMTAGEESAADAVLSGGGVTDGDLPGSDLAAKSRSAEQPDGSKGTQIGSQTAGQPGGNRESQKESGTLTQADTGKVPQGNGQNLDTSKAGAGIEKLAAGLRERKFILPVAVAVLVVVVTAAAVSVSGSHKKTSGNADSVLTERNPGTVQVNEESDASKESGSNGYGETATEATKEGIVYLLTGQTTHDLVQNRVWSMEQTYDENGKLQSKTLYGSDGTVSGRYIYVYDMYGNQASETFYEGDDTLSGRTAYTYDADGNVLSETFYESGDTVSHRIQYTYDTAGNLLTDTYYEGDDAVFRTIQYTYDAAGNRLSEKTYASDGAFTHEVRYTYDAAGNQLTETYYKNDGSVSKSFQYTYDADGNKLTVTERGSDDTVSKRQGYLYDKNGNQLACTDYDAEDNILQQREYTYDESDNILTYEESSLAHDGNTINKKEIYSYVYDEYGNILKKITYAEQADDAHITTIEAYEYIAITTQGA